MCPKDLDRFLTSITGAQPPFHSSENDGKDLGDAEVGHRNDKQRAKGVIGHALYRGVDLGQVHQGDIAYHGGLLHQDDEFAGIGGQAVLEGLGEDDVPHGLGTAQAQAAACLHLSGINCVDSGAVYLGHICRRVETKGDNRHQGLVVGDIQQDYVVHDQQLNHHGDAADDVDICGGRPPENPVPGQTHQTQHHAQHGTDADCAQGDGERCAQTAQIELPTVLKQKCCIQLFTKVRQPLAKASAEEPRTI